VIRRLLWLTLGAVLGVTGYRRLSALARSVPPALRVRELARFASDVREGMAVYAERHPRPAGRVPGNHAERGPRPPATPSRPDDVEDGRNGVG
jgi:hypothetical protein